MLRNALFTLENTKHSSGNVYIAHQKGIGITDGWGYHDDGIKVLLNTIHTLVIKEPEQEFDNYWNKRTYVLPVEFLL